MEFHHFLLSDKSSNIILLKINKRLSKSNRSKRRQIRNDSILHEGEYIRGNIEMG